jgi:hypothetical protein
MRERETERESGSRPGQYSAFAGRSFVIVLIAVTASRGLVGAAEPGNALATKLVRVSFRSDGDRMESVEGRALVTDQLGGLLVEDAAGTYWTITSDQLTERVELDEPFQWLDAEQLGISLQEAAGERAVVVTTSHYVIASRASRAYAKWCGALFERLRTGFLNYWDRAKLPLTPTDAPLPVIIFANRAQYAEYARNDGAAAVAEGFGYYSARTNRVVLFDLTSEAGGQPLGDSATRNEIQRRLSGATASIATVVHEATHQLAFNSGLQTRYADNPMWLTEGLAMFFETPDLRSATGWQSIGKVNTYRLLMFRKDLPNRPADSLTTLIQNDDRFRDPQQLLSAYAESWTLVHHLASARREKLVDYLKTLQAKPRLIFDTPQTRLAEFQKTFGEDLEAVDRDLKQHAARLRATP